MIKIYKITITKAYVASLELGTRFSLSPWSDNIDYEGFDDDGRDYVLPEGYDIGKDSDNQLHIYDSKGSYCELVKRYGNPAISVADNPLPVILKRVK